MQNAQKHDWLLSTLVDLVEYTKLNNLPATSKIIDAAAHTCRQEIALEYHVMQNALSIEKNRRGADIVSIFDDRESD